MISAIIICDDLVMNEANRYNVILPELPMVGDSIHIPHKDYTYILSIKKRDFSVKITNEYLTFHNHTNFDLDDIKLICTIEGCV